MNLGDLHPLDCPQFEYEHHPQRAIEIPRRVARILSDLHCGALDTLAASADTRRVHAILFSGLTPIGHPYFAGHYRGEEFRCLRRYQVSVGGRPGWPAHSVPGMMAELGGHIAAAIAALDAGYALPNVAVTEESKLHHTIQVACRFFELVCRVHPYANGNGHAARFCVWAILARYGYCPVRWPIDPRPPDPPYTSLLDAYRAGNRDQLEQFIRNCLD